MTLFPISIFLGGYITFVREACNMSCAELAKAIVVDYKYMWKIENGEKNVSMGRFQEIIEKLNRTPENFWDLMPAYRAYRIKTASEHASLEETKPKVPNALTEKNKPTKSIIQ